MKIFLNHVVEAAIWMSILVLGISMIMALFLPIVGAAQCNPWYILWLIGTCAWWAISGMLLRPLGKYLSDNF